MLFLVFPVAFTFSVLFVYVSYVPNQDVSSFSERCVPDPSWFPWCLAHSRASINVCEGGQRKDLDRPAGEKDIGNRAPGFQLTPSLLSHPPFSQQSLHSPKPAACQCSARQPGPWQGHLSPSLTPSSFSNPVPWVAAGPYGHSRTHVPSARTSLPCLGGPLSLSPARPATNAILSTAFKRPSCCPHPLAWDLRAP